jgi:hypothetical protein
MKATLALLAVVIFVFVQAASAQHDARASTNQISVLRSGVVQQRTWTWEWQDHNGVKRWPTVYAERHASLDYLHLLKRLWAHRHHQAQHSYVAPTGWIAKQIAAAEDIARKSGGDPWPNCPDPFDGGGSWQDTADCENHGSWMDSPGYYRCGLQFDPMWERVYGRLCP